MTTVTIKEEPKDEEQQAQAESGEPAALDYNAIYGNMYRELLAGHGNTNTTSDESTRSGSPKTAEQSKLVIPPECYADSFDIQDVVNEFKVTLEKFGVSQRVAAKYIMEDTSQGNLSFLMDKGKRLRWAELSPKGRIPYVKMKQWLDSKEKQINTIEIVKENKAITRQNAGRDAFQRRERFSLFQLTVLCRLFEENSNPSMTTRAAIAEKLNIPPERINVWFQNQRARGFPAKRILQQSFNAASSTNGAAKSASIMNSVAMEIVNQSKTDSFLANNTALVNQYVENSLYKNVTDDSDVHKMLLEYSASSDRKEEGNILPGSFDTTSSGSHKTDKSAEKGMVTKVKTEADNSSSLNEISREMTSSEKVNGYLNHLNQSNTTPAYGSQLDSVVKRISQSQSGAAKRKPAFLNKVLAQPKGPAHEKYPSPYSSPIAAPSNVLYDSSPLSALYRQTASVNFTPPNPSFNYLFDIGAAHLPGRDSDLLHNRRSEVIDGSYSEPKKRSHADSIGGWVPDFKRKKTMEHTINAITEAQAVNAKTVSGSAKPDGNSIGELSHNKSDNSLAKPVNTKRLNLEENKGSGDIDGVVAISAVQRHNTTNQWSGNTENSNAKEEDAPELKVGGDDNVTNINSLKEDIPHDVNGNKSSSEAVNKKVDRITSPAINGNLIQNTNVATDLEEMSDRLCGKRQDESNSDSENKRDKSVTQTETASKEFTLSNDRLTNVQTNVINKDFKETEDDTPVEKVKRNSNQNESDTEKDKINNESSNSAEKADGAHTDRPLSKDEMELFKSLYARFVKYHFAQMQFPEIK